MAITRKAAGTGTVAESYRRRQDERTAIQAKRQCLYICSLFAPPPPLPEPKKLRNLVQAAQALGARAGAPHDGETTAGHQAKLTKAAKTLDKKARYAARDDHWDHPLVQEWAAGRRSLGDYAALHALKNKVSGATAGISLKLELEDIWLRLVVEEIEANAKAPLTLAELQERLRDHLRSDDWLPPVMKKGLVHEATERMLEGRQSDAAGRRSLIAAAAAKRRALRNKLDKRLRATTEAFRKWLIDLELHKPRFRSS